MKLTTASSITIFTSAAFALSTVEHTANFDSDQAGETFVPPNFTQPYDGLLYQGFAPGPFNYAAGFCANVCPESFPIEVQFPANGTSAAALTATYPNSTALSFALQSLYFGLTQTYNLTTPSNPQGLTIALPSNGTIRVSGSPSPHLPAIAFQTFQYRPQIEFAPETGFPFATMDLAELSAAFQVPGIRYVSFKGTVDKVANESAAIYGAQGGGYYVSSLDGTGKVLMDNVTYAVLYE